MPFENLRIWHINWPLTLQKNLNKTYNLVNKYFKKSKKTIKLTRSGYELVGPKLDAFWEIHKETLQIMGKVCETVSDF